MLRGVLVTLTYDKTMRLSLKEAKKSAGVSVMSTDVEGVETVIFMFNEIWSGLITGGVGLYILSTKIGAASFLSVLPAISMYLSYLHVVVNSKQL